MRILQPFFHGAVENLCLPVAEHLGKQARAAAQAGNKRRAAELRRDPAREGQGLAKKSFDAVPGDTVFAHLALMDWGVEKWYCRLPVILAGVRPE